MQPHVKAIRAVGAEFVQRKLRGIGLLVGVAGVLALVALVVLADNGLWWLIPLFLLILIAAIGTLLLILVHLVRLVTPTMDRNQRQAVLQFVQRLDDVTEHLATPQFLVFFRIARDTISPRNTSFVQTVANDSLGLRTDYQKLVELLK